MKGRKSKTSNNTGHRYIHYDKNGNKHYAVTVDKKYIGRFETLERALEERDKILKV